MERDVTLALREDFNVPLGREHSGRALLKLLHIFGRNGINISQDYSLMAKAILCIEEVGRRLDPTFDLRAHARPVLQEVQRSRVRPGVLWRDVRDVLRSSFTGLKELPGELRRIARRLERDDLTIRFQHQGLEGLDDALKAAANRIALGVIIAALIVGSSLIITTRNPPYLFGYSALGMIGYLLSAVLGLYVVWDIFRHGRHR
jgi:ubiquinone biosynthesis protein